MRPMSTKKIKIHWWTNSSSQHTCHQNISGASWELTLLGGVDMGEDDGWYCWIKEIEDEKIVKKLIGGPYKLLFTAKNLIETTVDGEPLFTWD